MSASNTTNKGASATCSGATPHALGGGGKITTNTRVAGEDIAAFTESYPSSSTTWTVFANNGGANGKTNSTVWSIHAFVICGP